LKTLLLIDAYAMIYRAYYAFIRAPRMNSRGENTSAIFGFVVTLEDLIKRVKPTHMAVAFDPAGPTFRHEAYEQYKAQRQETPEDIRWAVPRIKQLLEAMNIPVLDVPGYEADDVIGTLAHKAEKEDFEVYMATPDKDYGQLVTDKVWMYRPRHTGGFEKLGPQEVCEKYGLTHQSQVIDLLGLMGDSSDNIPGCKGVGEKTAVQLLQQFGSIENLLANTDQLKGALQRKVQEQVEDIRFSYFLATIKTDVPIDFDAQSLVCQEKNWDKLAPLYRELEFNSLLKQAPVEVAKVTVATLNKKTKKPEATLDLFAALETDTTSLPLRKDTEGRANSTRIIRRTIGELFAQS
jgi:DNA polymerase-1